MSRNTLDLENWKSIPEETLLSIAEAAAILRVGETTVRNAIKSGRLRSYRPATGGAANGGYRIMMADTVAFLNGSEYTPEAASRENNSRPAVGRPFKHIEANWLREPSRQQEPQDEKSSARKPRSYGRSCGPGRPR